MTRTRTQNLFYLFATVTSFLPTYSVRKRSNHFCIALVVSQQSEASVSHHRDKLNRLIQNRLVYHSRQPHLRVSSSLLPSLPCFYASFFSPSSSFLHLSFLTSVHLLTLLLLLLLLSTSFPPSPPPHLSSSSLHIS